jgi:hypothetical protein
MKWISLLTCLNCDSMNTSFLPVRFLLSERLTAISLVHPSIASAVPVGECLFFPVHTGQDLGRNRGHQECNGEAGSRKDISNFLRRKETK